MLYEQEAYGLEAKPEASRGGENKKYIGISFQW